MEGIYLEIEQTGVLNTSVLINDIGYVSTIGSSAGFPRPQPVYIPIQGLGSVNVPLTSDVALSFERGAIRGFITAGYITATIRFGTAFQSALRLNAGWADYNDTATTLAPIACPAGVWTQLTNDGLGVVTNTSFLPPGVTQLWNTTTNEIDMSDLAVGDCVSLRIDLYVTPAMNNTGISWRVYFNAFGGFDLPAYLTAVNMGAGIEYHYTMSTIFYIGSTDVLTGGAEIQLQCTNDSTVRVQGFFLKVG